MSINSELTKLDAVRDALVVSVNNKGGGLDADSTLWQVKQAVDGITIGVDAPTVIQPAPAVSVNSSTGLVTATYTPVAGMVEDTAAKSATLQLSVQVAQTITPGTNDKTIAAGLYLTGTQTIKGDTNLVAGNIKSGVSIFGVSGEYGGDAVDAEIVIQPAPAVSVNSSTGLVTATYTPVAGLVEDTAVKSATLQLNTVGAKTITPGTEDKWLSAGNYLIGKQTIKGDANLVAGNIKSGVSIFGVSGSYEGSGGNVQVAEQPVPVIEMNGTTITASYLTNPGLVEKTERKSAVPLELDLAAIDEPTVNFNTTTGVFSATSHYNKGYIEYYTSKKKEYQLTVQAAQTITPGKYDQWVNSGRFLTGTQTIKGDANLVSENIKSGVSIFGVSGTYVGGQTSSSTGIDVPDTCIAFLGSDGNLYVRNGNGITVGGLTAKAYPPTGWKVYFGFTAGAIPGTVLSKDGVYLQWSGFSDSSKKWTIHSLVSGYPATPANWPDGTLRFAWGFDTQDWGMDGDYYTSDFPCYLFGKDNGSGSGGGHRSNTCFWLWDGRGNNTDVFAAGMWPAAFTWDAPAGKAYRLNGITHGNDATSTIIYPYDPDMGMPGDKYTVGNKLYLGRPSVCFDNNAKSGMLLGGFALELNPSGYTDPTAYVSPFLSGEYKNL